jgi:L-fuculose-phosphate aldolase
MSGDDARNRLVAAGERLAAAGLVHSSEGNLSVRLDASTCLVTPAGSNLGRLDPEELVEVSLDAPEIPVRATSEVQLHLELYRRRPEVWAVVHAHPSRLLRLDAAGGLPRSRIIEDRGRLLGKIVSADYFEEGSPALAAATADALARANACVLCGHGAVTVGSSLMQAYVRMLDLERAASLTPVRS